MKSNTRKTRPSSGSDIQAFYFAQTAGRPVRSWIVVAWCLGVSILASGQSQEDSVRTEDRAIKIEGYADVYYAWNPATGARQSNPFLVSSAKHNQTSLNLGYLQVRYQGKKVRANIAPGLGTYMSSNYSGERGWTKYILEANGGVQISPRGDVWLEAGVFSSPFTNETPVSRDQDMYLRSLAPELVPYFITGFRLSWKPSPKINLAGWVVNGWQVIRDPNRYKSFITQLTWDIHPKFRLYHNIMMGDERHPDAPTLRTRFLNDIYLNWKIKETLSATACFDVGHQANQDNSGSTWWQINGILRKTFTPQFSVSFRMEYFHDPRGAAVTQLIEGPRFEVFGAGACLNFKLHERSLLRLEGRHLESGQNIFPAGTKTSGSEKILALSLTSWF